MDRSLAVALGNCLRARRCVSVTKWQWIQLNAELVRHSGQALPSARALFGRIEPLMMRWRGEGRLRWFFFMRKPPDVRLRFLTISERETTQELAGLAAALQQEEVLGNIFFSQYRPETQR